MLNHTSKAYWIPPPDGGFEIAFKKAVHHGLMSENQYRFIARILCRGRPCDMLVIGAGYDAELWHHCVEGRIAIVEDKPEYLSRLPANGVYFEFDSNVGIWTQPPPPPYVINHAWDYILVDAPYGFAATCPGRQIPIAWAAQLGRKAVFVHDYDRDWERSVCGKYLGAPDSVLDADGRNDRKLAVYHRRRRTPYERWTSPS
jgi:hypothetical protein